MFEPLDGHDITKMRRQKFQDLVKKEKVLGKVRHGILICITSISLCITLVWIGFWAVYVWTVRHPSLASNHIETSTPTVFTLSNPDSIQSQQGDDDSSSFWDEWDRENPSQKWPSPAEPSYNSIPPTDLPEIQLVEVKVVEISDAELEAISRQLWQLDRGRIPDSSLRLHLQGQTNRTDKTDRAAEPLFSRMDASLSTWSDTYARFLDLIDNYNPVLRYPDRLTSQNWQEITRFLDVILHTDVIIALHEFLASKGVVSGELSAMRVHLESLWFSGYSRSPRYNESDSSGFEHVMVGELRGNKVIGLHNWIQLYEQERAGHANYQGYIAYDSRHETRFISTRLEWHYRLKRETSILVGVSPEYEIALYTLCALTRTGRECPVKVGETGIVIHTLDVSHIPGLQIATAYPTLQNLTPLH